MIVGLQIAKTIKVISLDIYSLTIFAIVISCLLFPVLFDKTFNDEGLISKKHSVMDKICLRETVLTNELLFERPLKEISFPPSCRIFMIVRDGDEFLPTGETVLKKGDILLMAGVRMHKEEMMNLVSGEKPENYTT